MRNKQRQPEKQMNNMFASIRDLIIGNQGGHQRSRQEKEERGDCKEEEDEEEPEIEPELVAFTRVNSKKKRKEALWT